MTFFNRIATPGLGQQADILQEKAHAYGQGKIKVQANVFNGNSCVHDVCLDWVDVGYHLSIGMVYNSQASLPWRLNQGKTIGALQGEVNQAESSIELVEADGHVSIYTYVAARQAYVNLTAMDSASTLTYQEGQWTGWDPRTGVKDIYDAKKRLVQMVDATGRQLNYTYTDEGRLAAIAGASGQLVFAQKGDGLTIYSLEAQQKTAWLHYQFEGDKLVSTTVPVDAKTNYQIQYDYYPETSLVKTINQADGTTLSLTYQEQTGVPYLHQITDGTEVTYTLDYAPTACTMSDALGERCVYLQNADAQLQSVSDAVHAVIYHYDEQGRVETVAYQDGTQTQYDYDDLGFYQRITNRNGEVTTITYDQTTGLRYQQSVILNAQTLDAQTQYHSYDDKRQLRYQLAGNGAVTQYDYDDQGNRIREIRYLADVFDTTSLPPGEALPPEVVAAWCAMQPQDQVLLTEFTYNERGQVSTKTQYATISTEGQGVFDESAGDQSQSLDRHNQCLYSKKRLNGTEWAENTRCFDGLQRLTQKVNALGVVTEIDYQGETTTRTNRATGLTTIATHNAGGRVVSGTQCAEAIARTSSVEYTKNGQPGIVRPCDGHPHYLVYDECRREQFHIDAKGYVTEKVYDANDHVLMKRRYATPVTSVDTAAILSGTWQPPLLGEVCTEVTVYDALGRLRFLVNGENAVIEKRYDAAGNLIETIAYATRLTLSPSAWLTANCPLTLSIEDRHERMFYNADNQLIGKQLANGQVVSYTRDSDGQLLSETHYAQPKAPLTTWAISQVSTSAEDATTTYRYDARGQCLTEQDAEGCVKHQTWDAGGRLVEVTGETDTLTSCYDAADRLVQTVHSSGLVNTWHYHACGKRDEHHQQAQADPSSLRSQLTGYNALAEVTYELAPRAAAAYQALSADPNAQQAVLASQSIQQIISPQGLRLATINELGFKTYFYYNAAKQLCFSVDPTGAVTEFQYDAFAEQPVLTRYYATRLPSNTLASLTGGWVDADWLACMQNLQDAARDEVSTVIYTKTQLPQVMTDGEQYQTINTYTAFDQLATVTQTIDGDDTVTQRMDYDLVGRQIQKTLDVGGLDIINTAEYDDANRAVTLTNGEGQTTLIRKDKLDREIRREDSQGIGVSKTWDAASRLTSKTDELNQVWTYAYDPTGLITTKTSPLGLQSQRENNVFGETVRVQNQDGVTARTIYDVDGQVSQQIDPEQQVTSQSYNIAGWLKQVDHPHGLTVVYAHDPLGAMQTQTEDPEHCQRITTFVRDTRGREIKKQDGRGFWTETTYDRRGLQTTQVIDPPGLALTTKNTYNGLQKRCSQTVGDATSVLQETHYHHDHLGRLVTTIVDPEGLKLTETIEYDRNHQVIAKTDANQHKRHSIYDANQHERYRVDATGGVIGFLYDHRGSKIEQVVYSQRVDPQDPAQLTLSALDQLPKPSLDQDTYFQWDADNRLVAQLTGAGLLTTYTYNAAGNKTSVYQYATPMNEWAPLPAQTKQDRVAQWFYDENQRERFYVNGEGIVTEKRYDAAGHVVLQKTYALAWTNRAVMPEVMQLASEDDRPLFYFYDSLGRVVYTVDGEGYVTENGYAAGDYPTDVWSYPHPITITESSTLDTVYQQLPSDKTKIPQVHHKYDAANQKIKVTDELGYTETFKLNALHQVTTYVDKMGEAWTYAYDGGGRRILETTPLVACVKTTLNAGITAADSTAQVQKKTEYDAVGNVIKVTEAQGQAEARTTSFSYNAENKLIQTEQADVWIDDPTQTPVLQTVQTGIFADKPKPLTDEVGDEWIAIKSADDELADLDDEWIIIEDKEPGVEPTTFVKSSLPEKQQTVTTKREYNAQNKPIIEMDEGGRITFKVYGDQGRLSYVVDSEAYVTAYSYDVFDQVVMVTRYSTPLVIDLSEYQQTGISVQDVKTHLVTSPEDRQVIYRFDRAGRQWAADQGQVFYYVARDDRALDLGLGNPGDHCMYNAFDEKHQTSRPINTTRNQWEIKQQWFDRRGQVIAETDADQYLTIYTRNAAGKVIEKTEYAQLLMHMTVSSGTTYAELIEAIIPRADDRYYVYTYNDRQELSSETQTKLSVQAINLTNNSPSMVDLGLVDQTTTYVVDAKGRRIKTTLPNQQVLITQYDARDLPILMTSMQRTLEDEQKVKYVVTPVVTRGYNAFKELTREIKHANPYENEAYLIPHADDQITLTVYDNRGLTMAEQDPEGALSYHAYTPTKQTARQWQWVMGWENRESLQPRLHQHLSQYSPRDCLVREEDQVAQGRGFITERRYNAFGEKGAEGPGDGTYPMYWAYDHAGNCWNTNEDNGIATIKLYDLRRQPTMTLRSMNNDLSKMTLSDLPTLVTWDYKNSQRIEMVRDPSGGLLKQRLPIFTTLNPNEPEPLPVSVVSGSLYPEFGTSNLNWPAPDIKALEAECRVWIKDHPEQVQVLPVIQKGDRYGVDTSHLATDEYTYQLDFFYRHPETDQRDGYPRYRASGTAFVVTSNYHATDHLVWAMQEDSRLILCGNVDNIVGVELWQDGKAVARVGVSNTGNPNALQVYFADQPSGKYEFKVLYGPMRLIDTADLGITSEQGTQLDLLKIDMTERYEWTVNTNQTVIRANWVAVPPMSNSYHRIVGINSTISGSHTDHVNFVMENGMAPQPPRPEDGSAFVLRWRNEGLSMPNVPIRTELFDLTRYRLGVGVTVSYSELYTRGDDGREWPVASFSDPLAGFFSQTYIYVQSPQLNQIDLLQEKLPDGTLKEMRAVAIWSEVKRLENPKSSNDCHTYNLYSLAECPSSESLGTLTIHTNNVPNRLVAREIGLQGVTCSKISSNRSWLMYGCGQDTDNHTYPEAWLSYRAGIANLNTAYRTGPKFLFTGSIALNMNWQLPADLQSNLIKVNLQVHFKNVGAPCSMGWYTQLRDCYDEFYNMEVQLGRSRHAPFNIPPFHSSNFGKDDEDFISDRYLYDQVDVTHVQVSVKIQNQWVPLLNATPVAIDRNVQGKEFINDVEPTDTSDDAVGIRVSGGTTRYYHVMPTPGIGRHYNEGDTATFPTTYTLWFYPLPDTITRAEMQYLDESLNPPIWRDMANMTLTGTGLSVPTDSIQPGVYPYRLKAWNQDNQPVNLESLAPITDGWAMGEFTVKHGGQLTETNPLQPETVAMQPERQQTLDRWNNVLSTTTASGHMTIYTYNGRNQMLTQQAPGIEVIGENGNGAVLAPKTQYGYDIQGDTIGVIDPNQHLLAHWRDYDGKVLKTMRADGVYQQFRLDIFGRQLAVRDPLNHQTVTRYNRNDLIVETVDANGWSTQYVYNELNQRVRITNGNGEVERYEYAQPLAQPTQHWPQLEQVTTMIWDRYGNMVSKLTPDGREMSWSRDYFGNLLEHQDLSGAVYQYEDYNYMQQVGHVYSDNGDHGERLFPDSHTTPQPGQNIRYEYDEASHTTAILDDALPLKTIRRYDIEGRVARETFFASDGHIHQAVISTWNSLGWLITIQDTVADVSYYYDLKGNRRGTIAAIYWDNAWQKNAVNYWFKYTPADDIQIDRGIVTNSGIEIAPGKGRQLVYDQAGRRYQEITQTSDGNQVVKTLGYLDNGLLQSIASSDGTPTKTFEYDGKVARRKQTLTSTTTLTTDYNVNGWDYHETYEDRDQKMFSETTYDLNAFGAPYHQTTAVKSIDSTKPADGYTDDLKTTYVSFDSDHIIETSGTRHRQSGDTTVATVKASLDPNGNVETIQGGTSESFRRFITNSDNRIVLKQADGNRYEYYFYTSDGQPIGRFGDIPDTEGMLGSLPQDINFDLNFHAVDDHFPPPTPQTYTVQSGDSFADISNDMYGDSSFADFLAHANGYSKSDTPPVGMNLQIPSVVNTNRHNWQGQYAPYNADAIVGSYYPNMPMPNRPPIILRPKKPSFWHILTEVFVGVVAFGVGIEFTGWLMGSMLTNLFAGFSTAIAPSAASFATNFVEGGIAGAFSNAAQQVATVELGDQSHFSWGTVGKAALMSGTGQGAGSAIGGSDWMNSLNAPSGSPLNGMEVGAETDLTTQGLTLLTGQTHQFSWASFVAATATGGINNAVNGALPASVDELKGISNDLTSVVVSTEVNHQINHTSADGTVMAATAIGTILGNQAVHGINAAVLAYDAYQAEQAEDAAFKEDLINTMISNRNQIQPGAGITTATDLPSRYPTTNKITNKNQSQYQSNLCLFNSANKPPAISRQANAELSVVHETQVARQANLAQVQSVRTMNAAAQSGSSSTAFWHSVDMVNEFGMATTLGLADLINHPYDNAIKPAAELLFDAAQVVYLGNDTGAEDRMIARAERIESSAETFMSSDGIARARMLGSTFGVGLFTAGAGAGIMGVLGSSAVEVEGAESAVSGMNNAKLIDKYDAYNPGVLSNRKANTFLGQKYQTYQLQEDTVLYRAGNSKDYLGEFFINTKPSSELQVRIDQAVLPKWSDGGSSVIDTGYAISVPRGTIVHIGEIAPQGNIFLGGTQQIFIEKPWLMPDVKLVDRFTLQQELLWNQIARK